jgi:hypothetical protein
MTKTDETLSNYFWALEVGDLKAILKLFCADAKVHSPFLGELDASVFFPKVFDSTSASIITVYDILQSIRGFRRAIGYFRYDWTLKDGTEISFEASDVFEFDDLGKITSLKILYDTHPIRADVGNKYD